MRSYVIPCPLSHEERGTRNILEGRRRLYQRGEAKGALFSWTFLPQKGRFEVCLRFGVS